MEELNHSELVALARLNEIPGASRSASREQLIEALSTFQPIANRDPIHGISLKMQKWLQKWWHRVRDTSPKDCCPNCPGCSDLQVLDCYDVNKGQMEK